MTATDVKTASEAAARLGVTVVTVKRWARSGRMQHIRKTPWLFESDEVERVAAKLLEETRAKLAHLADEAAS